MAKFARDCRSAFGGLCQQLEEQLGPETGDLKIRIGLHSGPVTAGRSARNGKTWNKCIGH
jgi:class 3 adenylate cyclase